MRNCSDEEVEDAYLTCFVPEERILDATGALARSITQFDGSEEALVIDVVDANLMDPIHLGKEVALLVGEATTCLRLVYSLTFDIMSPVLEHLGSVLVP